MSDTMNGGAAKENSSSGNNSFIMQAGILAAAGFVSKIIGTLYRTPLTAIIGNEGNGYYGTAYNIYLIILTIASYSMPTAISKIISGLLANRRYKNAQRVFRCALIYVTVMGIVGSLLLFFGADLFVEPNSARVLRVFTPTIVLYGYLGVLRGYFQAHRTMTQTSISQILEQIANAFVSIFAAYFLTNLAKDDEATLRAINGACGSALGTGSGVLVGLLFMIGMYLLNRKTIVKRMRRDRMSDSEVMSYGMIFKSLLLIVTPIIISSCIYNMNTVVNQTVFVRLLMKLKAYTESDASKLYGVYSGRVVVIANIPVALGAAMSSAIIPTVSTLFERGDYDGINKKMGDGIRATMLVSIPAAVGLCVLARPIMQLLQPSVEYFDLAVSLLRMMAQSVIVYQISSISNGVLQGIGKVNIPVINSGIALIAQTILIIPLVAFTEMNSYALVLATIFYTVLISVLNQFSVHRYTGYRQEMIKTFFAPTISSAFMGVAAWGVYNGLYALKLHYALCLFAAMMVAVPVYFVAIILISHLSAEDIRRLPKGRILAKIALKLHLVKEG